MCKMVKKLFVLVLVIGLVGTASADLIGHWKLDGNTLDSSTYGNNGITMGAGVTNAPDRFGVADSAMLFNGTSTGYINVGNAAVFSNMTGAMTLMSWCWYDGTMTRAGRIICKQSTSRAFSLNAEPLVNGVTNPGSFAVAPTSTTSLSVTDDATLPVNQWFHMAAVYTPGVSMEIYIDGVLAQSLTTGVPASQFNANGQNVLIGNRPGGAWGWLGMLDDVRIYNEALSQADIQTIMVPEPVTMLMLGLGGLALIRKRS
jgi:hypothetical protein